jgi:hypothetical protein
MFLSGFSLAGHCFVFEDDDVIGRARAPFRIFVKYCAGNCRRVRVRSVMMQRSAFSCFVPSAGADIVRNAFVSRRTYDKLTLEIPAMDPVAFGQLAISLFGTRRSLGEGAVVRSAVTLASGASHSNASGQI